MTIYDTSTSVVRYVEESTFGTTPASALKEARITGESLTEGISTQVSAEIRSDRQITDTILTARQPSGGINFEFSYAMLDDLIEGAFGSDWTTVSFSGTDIAAVASGNKYTSTSTDFTAHNLVVDQWILVAGFATAANNGWAQVVSFDATNLVVAGLTLVNESATPSISIKGDWLRNGTDKKSYSVEKELGTNLFMHFLGMRVGSAVLNIASNAILTGSVSFVGKESGTGTSTIGTGSPVAPPTWTPMSASSNVTDVYESGSPSSEYFTKIDITIDNGLRSQPAIGTPYNIGVGYGRCNVTGSAEVYFTGFTTYNKFINQTAFALEIPFSDLDGNKYMISMPNCKFSSGEITIGAADADILVPLNFQALMDPTNEYTIQLIRVAA